MFGKEPWSSTTTFGFSSHQRQVNSMQVHSKNVHRVAEKNIKYILLHTGDNNYATTSTYKYIFH